MIDREAVQHEAHRTCIPEKRGVPLGDDDPRREAEAPLLEKLDQVRLVARLERDGMLPYSGNAAQRRAHVETFTEVLADEIHQATIDGTLAGGS